MDAFQLLNVDLRHYIYRAGWPSLYPIQSAAIQAVHRHDHNLILAAPTASGKTEAAFLPAINAVRDFTGGCRIVYISPLIALINDQSQRLLDLCIDLDIVVTRWHGEATRSKKQKLLKQPTGILLITPESIEAMLALRAGEARALFRGTEWIIIDEIHSFLGSNRGVQLQSLLTRLKPYHAKEPRYIGMSATLNRADYQLAKAFFGSAKRCDVLLDRRQNGLIVSTSYYAKDIRGQSLEAIDEIYQYSKRESMLVFPNARAEVERIAVGLKQRAQREGIDIAYFAHHASISKDSRLQAEQFAKQSSGRPFTICCTTTLELGIDIGSVDSVVQVGAPHSVASLAQRLGRSGRHSKNSSLHFLATDAWSLLQGLAAIRCYRLGTIDQLNVVNKPFDVLAHQILAMLLEHNGLALTKLFKLNHLPIWQAISDAELKLLIDYLLAENYIERLGDEVILGRAAEKYLRGSDFFAHFNTDIGYSVYTSKRRIGDIPLLPGVQVGVNIYLSARIWTIEQIEHNNKKIYVIPAKDGKPPAFIGQGAQVSGDVRQAMKALLQQPDQWPSNDGAVVEVLTKLRAAHSFNGTHCFTEIDDDIALRSFASTRVNQTLLLMLTLSSETTSYRLNDHHTAITGPDIRQAIAELTIKPPSRSAIVNYLTNHPQLIDSFLQHHKYKTLLPLALRISYIVDELLAIEATIDFLQS